MSRPRFKSSKLAGRFYITKRSAVLMLAFVSVILQLAILFDNPADVPQQLSYVSGEQLAMMSDAQTNTAAPQEENYAPESGNEGAQAEPGEPDEDRTDPRPTLTVPPPPGVPIPEGAVLKYKESPKPGASGLPSQAGTPGLTHGTPGIVKGTPGKVKGTPGKVKGIPGKVKGTPGKVKGTPGVPGELRRPLTPTDILRGIIELEHNDKLKLSSAQARDLAAAIKELQSSYNDVWEVNGKIYTILTQEQIKWIVANPPSKKDVPSGPPEQNALGPAQEALKALEKAE